MRRLKQSATARSRDQGRARNLLPGCSWVKRSSAGKPGCYISAWGAFPALLLLMRWIMSGHGVVIVAAKRTPIGAFQGVLTPMTACLLYTSDAADDLTRVDLGGRRI